MRLTDQQLMQYRDEGFLLLPNFFAGAEITTLCDQLPDLVKRDTPDRVLEKDGGTVRAVHGCHATNEIYAALVRLPRLLDPAKQIVGGDVYVHQFKINTKAAFRGDVWQWHQDFVFWHYEDGMPEPRVVNVAVFLDEVNEFNGPLFVIPGSHKEGMIDVVAQAEAEARNGTAGWVANVSADLKYSLDQETVARLARQSDIVAPKGQAGSVLFFDSNIAHGSVPNLSPWDRRLLIVTYNSVENIPVGGLSQRPDFLVGRDYTPLMPVGNDALREVGATVL